MSENQTLSKKSVTEPIPSHESEAEKSKRKGDEVGALWFRRAQNGRPYLTGYLVLGDERFEISCFPTCPLFNDKQKPVSFPVLRIFPRRKKNEEI